MNQEVNRVLKPSGHFLSVSGAAPPSRLPHLRHSSLTWDVEHANMPGRAGVHVYVPLAAAAVPLLLLPRFCCSRHASRLTRSPAATTNIRYMLTKQVLSASEIAARALVAGDEADIGEEVELIDVEWEKLLAEPYYHKLAGIVKKEAQVGKCRLMTIRDEEAIMKVTAKIAAENDAKRA